MTIKMRSRGGVIAVVCAVALGGGSIALAARGGSASRSPNGMVKELVGRGEIVLLPPDTAGVGGWCLAEIRSGGEVSQRDCRVSEASAARGPYQGPVVMESGKGFMVLRGGTPWVTKVAALVTAPVAAVSFKGYRRIATHANMLLPDDLRGAIVELHGDKIESRQLPHFPSGHLIAWSRSGKRITQAFTLGTPLSFDVPSLAWSRGERAPRGVCAIRVSGSAERAFRNGGVMTAVRPHANVRGREFVNCAHSYYLLNEKWPIEANVLLDAEHPGARPARLRGMRPLGGHPGMFIGPSPENGELARRVPGAWLIVRKGEGISQRATLLEHLHVTLHIR